MRIDVAPAVTDDRKQKLVALIFRSDSGEIHTTIVVEPQTARLVAENMIKCADLLDARVVGATSMPGPPIPLKSN